MDYRITTHESLAYFSLYYPSFGRQPLLGRSVSNRLRTSAELDLDDEKAWVQGMAERTETFKQKIIMSMKNLAIAYTGDQLRYVTPGVVHTRQNRNGTLLGAWFMGSAGPQIRLTVAQARSLCR